ncbi:hypothetical protein [Mesorhizobium sp. M0074]|uniref:hypothetical protein n=1 Tax=Mesorhizobium sp. M0074 TaxID=2956869 RepID=UPI00333A9657
METTTCATSAVVAMPPSITRARAGMIFGAKSEKLAVLDPTQIALDLSDLCEVPVAANDDAAEDKDRMGGNLIRRNALNQNEL